MDIQKFYQLFDFTIPIRDTFKYLFFLSPSMEGVWVYILISVLAVSFISFIGIATLSLRAEKLKRILIYLISFSAGALLGDVFLHLLPEFIGQKGLEARSSLLILGGILIFFVLEKVIHWQHCHMPLDRQHVHPFAYTNLVGDGLHNFIDGIIIGASYLVSIPVGIATTLAVVLHEIPQEIGDFGVLLHAGFSKRKALWMNFLTALGAVLGAVAALVLSGYIEGLVSYLIPLAAGGFIYIAGSDLIPELHKDAGNGWRSLVQVIVFLLGIGVMSALLLLE